jgi:phosphomethylpyrimidine synthase
MSANPKFLAATAHVDEAAVKPLPNSRKVYVRARARHPRADARGPQATRRPVRRRAQPADLRLRLLGPVHRPEAQHRHPLGPAGAAPAWIEERGDTEVPATGPSSRYGMQRLSDAKLASCAST